jgi:hypothetical protein
VKIGEIVKKIKTGNKYTDLLPFKGKYEKQDKKNARRKYRKEENTT